MREKIQTQILSQAPFIAICDSFFTEEELQIFLDLNITRNSGVGHNFNDEPNPSRTSKSYYPKPREFIDATQKIVDRVNQEFSRHYTLKNTEDLQITRYGEGNFFLPHRDFHNFDRTNPLVAQDRIATVLLYINDNFEGGETYFPVLDISVKPLKGMLLFFEYPISQDLEVNYNTLHEGKVVKRGEKLIATQWFLEEKNELR
jgi:prolyl 4-hydroxylase